MQCNPYLYSWMHGANAECCLINEYEIHQKQDSAQKTRLEIIFQKRRTNEKKGLNIRPCNSIHTAPSHTVFSCYGGKKALLCSMDCTGTTTTMNMHV